jgi:DNA-binding LytR/AlgR family response regulator
MKLLFKQDIVQVEYVLYELPAAAILLVLVNTYYLVSYFYNRVSKLSAVRSLNASEGSEVPAVPSPDENPKKTDIILVNKGLKQLPLPVDRIAFIYKTNDNAFIKTFDGESFLTTFSLEEMEKILYENLFFRANRQVIVSRKACKSFTPLQFGKLELHLPDQYSDKIIISQKRAPAFRDWLLQFNPQ